MTPATLHNFSGLAASDEFKTNGFVLEPPDQGLCAGTLRNSNVVAEMINLTIAFYTTGGALISGPEGLTTFFQEPGPASSPTAEFLSDPRCVFDPSTQSWFFTLLGADPTATLTPDHVDVLVLNGVTGAESIYRVDVTFATDKAGGCPCLGDQPKVGIDANNLYLTVDQFNTAETLETGDSLIALSKSQLVAGSSAVNAAEWHNLSLGGIRVTSLQPAITTGASGSEFLLNSFPYSANPAESPVTTSTQLGLWSVTEPAAVTAGKTPRLTAVIVTSETYNFPVPALSTNGLSLATYSNDSRMQQVQFVNGALWGALDSALTVGQDPAVRDGVAWFKIVPATDRSGAVTGATFVDQGYVASAGQYLLYPAITTTRGGATGIAMSVTSPTLNPSTGFVERLAGQASFGGVQLTAVGPKPDIGFTCDLGFPQQCRWGDYSWSTLDPNGHDVWMASELTVTQTTTQSFGHNQTLKINWGTQVWDVPGS